MRRLSLIETDSLIETGILNDYSYTNERLFIINFNKWWFHFTQNLFIFRCIVLKSVCMDASCMTLKLIDCKVYKGTWL